ncbi:HAMP domain-containing sensor histidine kinase [Alicyclobacillus sp. SO9]|uniref:sensor histidine kinase n=1 Tax=Alicyclobacillus sp. SO9 TaxID=2665646 RepID=UPI0018E7FD59|nr:HAMP domain-containing sensor histidine kinase [Alicyclobacillus sp. SO9]QQE78015.1 HAMP domain-containing histidine kinase [Alicyclobacillus sp. SO9]
MFRRVYWQIATMLMASTLALFLVIGGSVYWELRAQLRHDEKVDLQSELPEIETLVASPYLIDSKHEPKKYHLHDDKGQHIYFLILNRHKVVASSATLPTSAKQLQLDLASGGSHHVLEYHELPYLVYSTTWTYHDKTFTIHVIKSIWAQEHTLHRALQLMLLSGAIGMMVALGLNLWLGRRVLNPALDMFNMQQNLMTELSHEMQTPLATLNVLSAQVEQPALREQLQYEVLHASDLIQDILYLAKLRSLPTEDVEPVAVSDLTEEVAVRLCILAERNGIVLSGKAEQGVFVETNPEYWKRLVSTLLKNVVDHAATPSQASWHLTRTDRLVQLVVTNEVPAQTYVTHELHSKNFTGFGISIVHRLVESMGGTVELTQTGSEVTATVRVPALVPKD